MSDNSTDKVEKNSAWLNQVIEQALEPEIAICDPHHHLWVKQSHRAWPRYLLEEFLADLNSGHNVVSTVFIECGEMYKLNGPKALRVIGETEFINGIAAMSASGQFGNCRIASGIVATADLTLGTQVMPILESQMVAAGGRLRGIRYGVAWHPNLKIPQIRTRPGENLLSNSKFRHGFKCLKPLDLIFECWCYHPQINDLSNLAKAFPDTQIILNHFGIPLGISPFKDKSVEVFREWRKDIKELANCENVLVKLGGINMPENGFGWHNRDKPPTSKELIKATRPYYEAAIEIFGVTRCMFESNFPVDKISCSYSVLWNSFKRLTKNYSSDEKRQLFHDTATRAYRL